MKIEDSAAKNAHARKIGRAQMKFRVLRALAARKRLIPANYAGDESLLRLDELDQIIQMMKLVPFTNDDD